MEVLDDISVEIEKYAIVDLYTEVARARAALVENVEKLGMTDDSGPAPFQLDIDALEDIGLPAFSAEQGCGEQAGNGSSDDNGPLGHVSTPGPFIISSC